VKCHWIKRHGATKYRWHNKGEISPDFNIRNSISILEGSFHFKVFSKFNFWLNDHRWFGHLWTVDSNKQLLSSIKGNYRVRTIFGGLTRVIISCILFIEKYTLHIAHLQIILNKGNYSIWLFYCFENVFKGHSGCLFVHFCLFCTEFTTEKILVVGRIRTWIFRVEGNHHLRLIFRTFVHMFQ